HVADELLVIRLVASLRKNHADTRIRLPTSIGTVGQLSGDTLQHMVRNGVDRARTYGLRHENALAAFVLVMFEFAPNFDADPFLHSMLTNKDVGPDSRLDKLLREATKQHWEAVVGSYDPDAWGLP